MKKVLICVVFSVWATFLVELRSLDYVFDEFGIDYSNAEVNLESELGILAKQAEYDVRNITKGIPKYSKQTIKPMNEASVEMQRLFIQSIGGV